MGLVKQDIQAHKTLNSQILALPFGVLGDPDSVLIRFRPLGVLKPSRGPPSPTGVLALEGGAEEGCCCCGGRGMWE